MINFKSFTDLEWSRYYGYGGNLEGGYGRLLPIFYQVNPQVWFEAGVNEYWHIRAQRLTQKQPLAGLKVLELGCAFGSLVKALRSYGVDAYGLDLAWPIGVAVGDIPRPPEYPPEAIWSELKPYLIVSDALTYLKSQSPGSWDVILSIGFLECFSDADLTPLISEMFRVAQAQIHVVDPTVDPTYYNRKTLVQWKTLFKSKALILDGV
ncbi:MAG: class I SAM-dependent methyltransferase [Candidatus Methanomethylicaceae archaeon]